MCCLFWVDFLYFIYGTPLIYLYGSLLLCGCCCLAMTIAAALNIYCGVYYTRKESFCCYKKCSRWRSRWRCIMWDRPRKVFFIDLWGRFRNRAGSTYWKQALHWLYSLFFLPNPFPFITYRRRTDGTPYANKSKTVKWVVSTTEFWSLRPLRSRDIHLDCLL